MMDKDISQNMSKSDEILQSLFNDLTETLGSSPDGDLMFKYQGAHKSLEFAFTDERDSEKITQSDFSNFINLCEKLQESMYSYENGTWISFSLMVNNDETFAASFNFDGYPTDINDEPLSLDAVRELFEQYPRKITPEWLV